MIQSKKKILYYFQNLSSSSIALAVVVTGAVSKCIFTYTLGGVWSLGQHASVCQSCEEHQEQTKDQRRPQGLLFL